MKIKTIDVQAKEWFDKTKGNSHFSGTVILNHGTKTEKVVYMPFQYGYGDHYQTVAQKLLQDKGLLPADASRGLWSQCREKGIILRAHKITGCKKSELK